MSVWASPKGITSMLRKPSGFTGEGSSTLRSSRRSLLRLNSS